MGLLSEGQWSGRLFSGGWRDGGGGVRASVEPATGKSLGRAGLASVGDVDEAVELARQAQPGWAAESYEERAAVLRRAADLLEAHHEEIEDWSMREAGVPRYWAGVGGPAEQLRQAASLASYPLGKVLPSTPAAAVHHPSPSGGCSGCHRPV